MVWFGDELSGLIINAHKVLSLVSEKLTQPHDNFFETCGLVRDNFVSAHLFLDRRTSNGWNEGAQRGAESERDERRRELKFRNILLLSGQRPPEST